MTWVTAGRTPRHRDGGAAAPFPSPPGQVGHHPDTSRPRHNSDSKNRDKAHLLQLWLLLLVCEHTVKGTQEPTLGTVTKFTEIPGSATTSQGCS